MHFHLLFSFTHVQVTRLIPNSKGTKCNQELEPIYDTKHSHILRIPFKTEQAILPQWVSRFDIYPYLGRFAQAYSSLASNIHFFCLFFPSILHTYFEISVLSKQDATAKILDLMEGKPDLIIGNYSDGNLVASLMASKLGITQVKTVISDSFNNILKITHFQLYDICSSFASTKSRQLLHML